MASPDFKVVLLGAKNVGKTSVFNRYVYDEFGETQMTIGAYFATKTVDVDAVGSASPSQVQLAVWDTAGEERFDSLTNFYCRQSRAALVVYDVTDRASFAALDRWCDKVVAEAHERCVVILVGNKVDAVPGHVWDGDGDGSGGDAGASDAAATPTAAAAAACVPLREAQAYAARLSERLGAEVVCAQVSARTGEGVAAAFRTMVRVCAERRLIGSDNGDGGGGGGDGGGSKRGQRLEQSGGGSGGSSGKQKGKGCC